MLDDFLDDEGQEFLGEFRVQIGPVRKVFETRDLAFLTRGVRGRQVVLGLEPSARLGVFEALAQRVDDDRIETGLRGSVFVLMRGGAGGGVAHVSLSRCSPGPGWRQTCIRPYCGWS